MKKSKRIKMKEYIPNFFDDHIRSMEDLSEQFDTIANKIINEIKKID